MSANDNCQFVLERINVPGVILLDQPDHTYTCGRAKENQIVCLSLMVSRRHCIFFRSKNELYVTDLKSANGLYINGVVQEPFQTTKLCSNDVIGIGCPTAADNNTYVYKLRAVGPQLVENNHSASALSETVLNNENICNDKSPIDDVHKSTKRKRETRYSLNISPSKIPRLGSENCISDKKSSEGNIIFLFRLFNI
ncbi:hypothetical protein K0M31_018810 [Melipona bicolor]|uniref:FHA domain-containing protein n=1 Tax=Melipona bicolor TaxID=60889 RepID=A0AA40G409_9HYME|nr:hypothetical protein K0M31_018810 [Melipona bicolor]